MKRRFNLDGFIAAGWLLICGAQAFDNGYPIISAICLIWACAGWYEVFPKT